MRGLGKKMGRKRWGKEGDIGSGNEKTLSETGFACLVLVFEPTKLDSC
jgi:hypothetical protein